jgi:hypothetical protein
VSSALSVGFVLPRYFSSGSDVRFIDQHILRIIQYITSHHTLYSSHRSACYIKHYFAIARNTHSRTLYIESSTRPGSDIATAIALLLSTWYRYKETRSSYAHTPEHRNKTLECSRLPSATTKQQLSNHLARLLHIAHHTSPTESLNTTNLSRPQQQPQPLQNQTQCSPPSQPSSSAPQSHAAQAQACNS